MSVTPATLTRAPSDDGSSHYVPYGFDRATLDDFDYVEEEWFASGEEDGHPYETTVLVRRPRNVGRFSGTVLAEPVHLHGIAPIWMYAHPYVMRSGHGWVAIASQRAEHLGTDLDCPLCDRAELPEGLDLARTAGPFDQATLPAALQRDHRVADRTWAVLRVLDGEVDVEMDTIPPIRRRLVAGDEQPIPPTVLHHVRLPRPAALEIDFLVGRPRPDHQR
jgi:tellurite resistance-related uncharacterized protein